MKEERERRKGMEKDLYIYIYIILKKSRDAHVIRLSVWGIMELREERVELWGRGRGRNNARSWRRDKNSFPFLCTLENGHLKLCGWSVPEED